MMKNTILKISSLILILALVFAMVAGCNGTAGNDSSDASSNKRPSIYTESVSDESSNIESSSETMDASNVNVSSEETSTPDNTEETESKQDVIVSVEEVEYDPEKNPLKRGVNFSNFEMHWEVGYDNWIFQSKYYDMLREKGFDHVRLPVDFFDYINFTDSPNYTIDEETFRKIDTIINTALSAGMKIVLDFHHFGELQKNYTVNREKYLKIWEQISVRYQSYPSGLVFELFNEPGNPNTVKNAPDPINPARCLIIQNEAIEIIRKTNPTRLIVHATKLNNAVSMLEETSLTDDKNIIMSVHVYEPFTFTHQGTEWLSDEFSGTRPYGEDVRTELTEIFAEISAYQKKTGVPVWIGEFGVTNKATGEDRYKYAALINELSKEYGVGWCWFEFSTGFGFYNLEKDEWTADGVADALTK